MATPKVTKQVDLDEELAEALEREARRKDIPQTELMRQLIRDGLSRRLAEQARIKEASDGN